MSITKAKDSFVGNNGYVCPKLTGLPFACNECSNIRCAYLNEYFEIIPENERNNTKYFISDMYDDYKNICHRFFSKVIHIVNLFHVINQLTNSVNKVKSNSHEESYENTTVYKFMKAHWKRFLCRKENIPDKYYCSKLTGEIYKYDDLVFRCVLKDQELLEGYYILQAYFTIINIFLVLMKALNLLLRFLTD